MNYQKIYEFDLANGKGVRVSLFVSGCNIRCKGCFNSCAWDFNSGKPFTKKVFKKIKQILKNPNYDGLSILGGEPLDQNKKGIKQLIKLCKVAHRYKKNVWLWTGHCVEEITDTYQIKLLHNADVIIDGPFIEDQKNYNLPFRGSNNQRMFA